MAEDDVQTNTEASEEELSDSLYGESEETKESAEAEEAKEGTEESKDESKESKETGEKEEGVPEKYELKLGKESILDNDDLKRIAEEAKELGLTNDEAQEMADLENDAAVRYHNKLLKEVEGKQEKWIEDARDDKEIGGDNFKESSELAKRVVEKFGSDEFKKLMNETKYGDHPEVIRIFSKIGKLMANDEAVFSREKSNADKPIEDIFYPTTKE